MSLSLRSHRIPGRTVSADTRRSRESDRPAARASAADWAGPRASAAASAAGVERLEGRLLLATHLSPVADTFVRNHAFQDVNFGAAPYLWVKTETPSGGDSRVGYLKFDLGSLDANEIGSATLYLSGALQSPSTQAITAGVFAVGDTGWQEGNGNVSVRRLGAPGGGGSQITGSAIGDGYDTSGGMDWNNQPGSASSPLATATVRGETFKTYAFDVTSYVRSQAGGGGNNLVSLAVKGNEATTAFMRFISSNFDGPGGPQLVITRPGNPGGSFVRTSVSANPITAGGGQTHSVVVSYDGEAPIDFGRLDLNDIRVRRADGEALAVVGIGADSPIPDASVNVTYLVQGPGGGWDKADNGVYTIEVPRDEVRDGNGNENAAALGSFRVAIDDNLAPLATIFAEPVTAAGGNTYRFTVNYSDDGAIDAESVNINNVLVTTGSTTLTVTQVDLTPDADAGQVSATYTVLAPGGSWDRTDNGSYSITARNSQVRDTAGHDISETFGSFGVDIGQPDNAAPVATSVTAADVTSAGGTGHAVTVIYDDNVAIDVASIDAGDVVVTGLGGAPLAVGQPQVNTPTDGSPRTVVYPVTPAGGSWDPGDNGTYSITVLAGAVRDTSGNANAQASGSFQVSAGGVDNVAPHVAQVTAPDVTAAGAPEYVFSVAYADNVAVSVASVDIGDVTVTGPGGVVLPVVGVAPDPNADSGQIVVSYRVTARGGSWDFGDNGPYTITVNNGQVTDVNGNAVPGGAAGGFTVAAPNVDATRPTADVNALSVTSEGAGQYSFTVTYHDNAGIRPETVGNDDVTVTGPGGPLAVNSNQAVASGTDLAVTYFVTPPGNSWDAADNGAYTITVNENAVLDTSNNGVVGKSQGFQVNVNAPDSLGPQGTITAPPVAVTGAEYLVTVKWQDDTSIRVASLDLDDITVSGGPRNEVLPVTKVDFTPREGGQVVTATYTVSPPGGVWDPGDNGTYTVTINADKVHDGPGHNAQPGSATFSVQVADSQTPAATFSVPSVVASTNEQQSIVITFSDDVAMNVASLDSGDITITGPGGSIPVVAHTTSENANVREIVSTYVINPPGGTWDVSDNGTYTVTINAGSVTDAAGNPAVGTATFTVNVQGPPVIDGPPINAGFTIEAMTTQESDNKTILVGRQRNPALPGTGQFQAVLQRRNADGSLDATFGNGGTILSDPAVNAIYYSVIVTAAGIVVAGTQDGHWVVARYNFFGQPDPSFGTGGRTVVTFNGGNESAYALAVDPRNGAIVVGGGSPAGPDDGQPDQNFALARLTPNGVLDTAFAQGGLQLFDINGEDVVGAVTVLQDGRIVAAGSSGADVSLFRLAANGEPDPGFSGDGFLSVSGLRSRDETGFFVDHSQALAIQDGKILVGNHSADGNFAVARIDANGNLDSTFGANGTATVDFNANGVDSQDDVDSIVLQPNGVIILVGTTTSGVGNSPATAVAALGRDGNLLTGWNEGGKLVLEPAIVSDAGRELHIGDLILRAFGTRQSDGRLVVGASDRTPTPTSSAFRKIVVPGLTAPQEGELLGTFGVGSTNKGGRFTYRDADGTLVTFILKGNATGRVYLSGDKLNVTVEDQSGGTVPCSVIIKARGGDRRVKIGDIRCTGALKSLSAKAADLSGTMYVRGAAGKLALGTVDGGTVAAAGPITSLVATSLTNAMLLSGANLGGDFKLGGQPTDGTADTFDQGYIGALKVAGAINGSIIAAGLKPMDATIGNEDDVVVGGAGAPGGPFSIIRRISAKGGADETTRFIAGGFGAVKLPQKVDPANDPQSRFTVK